MTCSCSTKMVGSALLVILIIGALTLFAYTSEQNALKGATQMGMKSTVAVMATQVNASDIRRPQAGGRDVPAIPRRGKETGDHAQHG